MPPVLIYRAAPDEIEEILIKAMPLGSVKTHVTRGKARLRELLQDWAQVDSGSKP